MTLTQQFLDTLTLEQLAERLRLALDGADLGIWDWDLRDNSVQFDWRWCAMLGLDHATTPMTLETWSSRVHPDDIAGCYRDIEAHVQGRTTQYENIHRMRHADGSWRVILDRGRIAGRDEAGAPIRFTGTHLDLTAVRLAEERARVEQEARLTMATHLAGSLAHELNTPLQVMLLAASTLASLVPPDSAGAEAVQAIETMVERASRVTRALRLLAVEDDVSTECALESIVEAACALFEARLQGHEIRLIVQHDTAGVPCAAQPADVLRVLVVLIHAAMEAMRHGPSDERVLELRTTASADALILHCADSRTASPAPERALANVLSPTDLLDVLLPRFDGRLECEERPDAMVYRVAIPRGPRS